MSFKVGFKLLKRLCQDQKPLAWHRAKLNKELFHGVEEQEAYEWVANHIGKHHALPNVDTLSQAFPEFKQFDAPEPVSYYLDTVERRFKMTIINQANIASQALLKEAQSSVNGSEEKVEQAVKLLKETTDKVLRRDYSSRILNLGKEAPTLVLSTYGSLNEKESKVIFGWPYLDDQCGGALPGDLISFVGRPATGKTFLGLYTALRNWVLGRNVMFVSMEMNPLAIAQRLAAMYSHVSLTQLKSHTFPSKTMEKFMKSLVGMANEDAEFYVVNGNLAATPEDIYMLADQLQVDMICIDGAYLMKHKNPRLDRFTKVAENTETMKHLTEVIEIPTFASWQLSREAAKKSKKKGDGETIGIEDISMSDAVGQASSIVLGLFQDDSVETSEGRIIEVMKGRDGQVGRFPIHWDFDKMNFDQMLDADALIEEDVPENAHYM